MGGAYAKRKRPVRRPVFYGVPSRQKRQAVLAEGSDPPFVLLQVCVPDGFELDLGCDPCSRFLSFFPDPFGNHLVFDNGSAEKAIDERVWAAWLDAPLPHNRVEQAMRGRFCWIPVRVGSTPAASRRREIFCIATVSPGIAAPTADTGKIVSLVAWL